MDNNKLGNDIQILQSLKGQGAIKDVDWNIDGVDNWIIIYGAAKLPERRFSYSDFNLKLPIPADLYEPKGGGKYGYYGYLLIDSDLRVKVGNEWRPIARQFPDMNSKEAAKGWSFLCLYPHDVDEGTDIRALIPIVQEWIISS